MRGDDLTDEIRDAMTAPAKPTSLGRPPLAKRGGPKGLVPGSWVSRGVRVEYRGADGRAQTLSGKLLDTFPTGLVVGADGGRTLLSWDAFVLLELVDG
jgi:hypothetical protein